MDVMSDLTELLQTQHLFSDVRVEQQQQHQQQAMSPISHVVARPTEHPAVPINDDQVLHHLQLLVGCSDV